MRRFLDRLYAASGALAAVSLASIAVVMLLQAGMREAGLLLRGADDIVAWLCAASAFLALGHTFRHGELVRVGLIIERLPARVRRPTEIATLIVALLVVGYIVYAAVRFVYESWKFEEVAQGLIQIPIWIPQMSFVAGAIVFFIAVLDEFVVLLRGGPTAYQAAENARRARKDFTESL
ncbi:MAG: C4-dicarboxylate ABC transporter permease [Betaproteobacteria bacterium RIFCSPLOWO2_12_FULL_65_14]|nr:MAG: C4-dicarboxylate ABC transporter permease [Betaproteobacteria bacterium RIFCSPLOWO2_12_FULL_65_14]